MTAGKPRLVACPLGFDERFVVRAIIQLRLGLGSHDALALFLPVEGDPRGLDAFNRVKRMVESYNLDLTLSLSEISVDDFWKGAGQIRKCLEELANKLGSPKLCVVLGGGMRILSLQVLIGVLALNLGGDVLIYREDLKGSVTFSLDALRGLKKPSEEHLKILRVIRRRPGLSFSELADEISMPKATLHKRLQELKDMGLVSVRHEGRRVFISTTPRASLWLSDQQ